MSCGIYKITNQVNGKIYIGQSTNIKRRWREEKHNAFSESSNEYDCYRSKAFRKYGLENFTFEVIEECVTEKLNERERYWADYYDSYTPKGYNVAICGGGGHSQKIQDFGVIFQIINDLKFTNLSGVELGIKYGLSDQTISDINTGRAWYQDDVEYPIRPKRVKIEYFCICGKQVSQKGCLCRTCAQIKSRTVERPSKEQLLEEIATSSFTSVGKKYGVSDNAIKKWCVSYGLPKLKKDLVELYKNK